MRILIRHAVCTVSGGGRFTAAALARSGDRPGLEWAAGRWIAISCSPFWRLVRCGMGTAQQTRSMGRPHLEMPGGMRNVAAAAPVTAMRRVVHGAGSSGRLVPAFRRRGSPQDGPWPASQRRARVSPALPFRRAPSGRLEQGSNVSNTATSRDRLRSGGGSVTQNLPRSAVEVWIPRCIVSPSRSRHTIRYPRPVNGWLGEFETVVRASAVGPLSRPGRPTM